MHDRCCCHRQGNRMDPADDHEMVREVELKNGITLSIKQKTIGDVGCVVWDAALVLLHYLENEYFFRRFHSLADQYVVELGSGTGVVGIVAGVHKAKVVITDLEDFVPLINDNINNNKEHLHGNVWPETLKWGTEPDPEKIPPSPNFIIFSDCVYYGKAVVPLVTTLTAISDESTHILCSYEERTIGENKSSLQSFMELIKEKFVVTEIPFEEMDSTYRSEDIHILHMKKQPK